MNGIPCKRFNSALVRNHYGAEGKNWMTFASFVQMDITVGCPKHKRVFFAVGEKNPRKIGYETCRWDTKLLDHFTGGKIPDNDVTVIA